MILVYGVFTLVCNLLADLATAGSIRGCGIEHAVLRIALGTLALLSVLLCWRPWSRPGT